MMDGWGCLGSAVEEIHPDGSGGRSRHALLPPLSGHPNWLAVVRLLLLELWKPFEHCPSTPSQAQAQARSKREQPTSRFAPRLTGPWGPPTFVLAARCDLEVPWTDHPRNFLIKLNPGLRCVFQKL